MLRDHTDNSPDEGAVWSNFLADKATFSFPHRTPTYTRAIASHHGRAVVPRRHRRELRLGVRVSAVRVCGGGLLARGRGAVRGAAGDQYRLGDVH